MNAKKTAQRRGAKRNPWPRKAANKAYAAIVSDNPDRTLTDGQEQVIETYSQDVFGSSEYKHWLRVYTALRGKFIEGWLPDNYFMVLRERLDPYRELGNIRTIMPRLLSTPYLPDIVSCSRGNWCDAAGNPISRDDARAMCFATGDTVFLKANDSRRSRGTVEISEREFEDLGRGDQEHFVVQRKIAQHSTFADWTPNCVHTIRLTTFKGSGQAAQLRGGVLRVGRDASNVVLSESLLRLPIDTQVGVTMDTAYTPLWHASDMHPDSGVPLGGKIIPNFEYLKQTLLDLHDRFPHVAIIGWDVSIEEDGSPVIMELNTNRPDIKLAEAATGPHFADLAHQQMYPIAAQ